MKKAVLFVILALLLVGTVLAFARTTKPITRIEPIEPIVVDEPVADEPVVEEPIFVEDPVVDEPVDEGDGKTVVFHKRDVAATPVLEVDREDLDPEGDSLDKMVGGTDLTAEDVVIPPDPTDPGPSDATNMDVLQSSEMVMYEGHEPYGSGPELDHETPYGMPAEDMVAQEVLESEYYNEKDEEPTTLTVKDQNRHTDLDAGFEGDKVDPYAQEEGLLSKMFTTMKNIFTGSGFSEGVETHEPTHVVDDMDVEVVSSEIHQEGEHATFWARVKSWFVGPDEGSHDLPEVDDENLDDDEMTAEFMKLNIQDPGSSDDDSEITIIKPVEDEIHLLPNKSTKAKEK
jgi:hypothetical protein